MTVIKPMPMTENRPIDQAERLFDRFVTQLQELGYSFRPLQQDYPSFLDRHVYLRHDILPTAIDIDVGLQLAAVHERLKIPGTFHIAWDLLAGHRQLRDRALRLRDFDSAYVHLGLHCDPISSWLAEEDFGGDQRALTQYAASPAFASYLEQMLAAWHRDGAAAPALRSLREGAWAALAGLDRSFRHAAGRCSSLSGRGSPLSAAYVKARQAHPELEALAGWFQPIDFLSTVALGRLGYAFEATRFPADLGPGPTVLFGGAAGSSLRRSFDARIGAGRGFLAILPIRYWAENRYANLLRERIGAALARESADDLLTLGAAAAPTPLPDRPFLTRNADLIPFGARCERLDTGQLAAAARQKIGDAVDRSFSRFIDSLRAEGYSFSGFEDGVLRFDERRVYLRYDVHIQDLLAAYVLADLHERLGIVGSFQILWKFSRSEEMAEPYFTKLLEFDRRFVQFGLHVAPTATWYLNEKLNGDHTRQREAADSDEFVDWLLDLRAAFCRDGDAATELRKIRDGTDDTLSGIAASFRDTFGNWKSISGHGNFLTRGFVRAAARHPQLEVLRPYFVPVAYLSKFGVARFGFDFEATAVGGDRVPFPRVIDENPDTEARRRCYRGRIANGAGFVALLHPASWTYSRNATFFLPAEDAGQTRTVPSQAEA